MFNKSQNILNQPKCIQAKFYFAIQNQAAISFLSLITNTVASYNLEVSTVRKVRLAVKL